MRENLRRNQLEAALSEECLESVETLGAASVGAGWQDELALVHPQWALLVALYALSWVGLLAAQGLYRPRARWSAYSDAIAIARSAVAIGARVLWLQLGIRNPEAVAIGEAAGRTVIEDHCMKIEYGRLSGELAWSGINTRILSSHRWRYLG
jgi:hypothetical protein